MRPTAITQSHLTGQPESSWPFSTCVSTSALVSNSMGTSVFISAIVCSLCLCLCLSPFLLLLPSVSSLGSSGLDGFPCCIFCLSPSLTFLVFFLLLFLSLVSCCDCLCVPVFLSLFVTISASLLSLCGLLLVSYPSVCGRRVAAVY